MRAASQLLVDGFQRCGQDIQDYLALPSYGLGKITVAGGLPSACRTAACIEALAARSSSIELYDCSVAGWRRSSALPGRAQSFSPARSDNWLALYRRPTPS